MSGNRYAIKRNISKFKGQILIFGGDASELESYANDYQVKNPRNEFYTVNILSDAKTDLLADVTDSKQLACLPKNRFNVVYFSYLPLVINDAKSAVESAFRLLNEEKGMLVLTSSFKNIETWADKFADYSREYGLIDEPIENQGKFKALRKNHKQEEYKLTLELLHATGFKAVYCDKYASPSQGNTGIIIAFKGMTTDLTNSPHSTQVIIARSLYNLLNLFSREGKPDIVNVIRCFQHRSGIARDLGLPIYDNAKQETEVKKNNSIHIPTSINYFAALKNKWDNLSPAWKYLAAFGVIAGGILITLSTAGSILFWGGIVLAGLSTLGITSGTLMQQPAANINLHGMNNAASHTIGTLAVVSKRLDFEPSKTNPPTQNALNVTQNNPPLLSNATDKQVRNSTYKQKRH